MDFYSFDKEHASDNVKYKTKERYPEKVFIWLALSSKSISTAFIGTTKDPAILPPTFVLINI